MVLALAIKVYERTRNLRWLRVIGDTIFAVSVVGLGWFILGLKIGWSYADSPTPSAVSDTAPILGK